MIIINARFLTQPITGVQRFAAELSKILKKQLPNKVHFVTHYGVIHKDLAKELNAEIIGLNKSHLWEQVDLYLYLLKKNSPLLLSFGYTGPLFYPNQIISVHDMAFKYYKNTFSKKFALTYNFLVPKIAKKCLHVLTVSESAKTEICNELNLPKNKVSVIYNGLSEAFKEKQNEGVLNGNNERYILSVSSHHARKNYKRLIHSFSLIKDESLKLFIIGNVVSNFSKSLDENDLALDSRINFLNNISDEELSLYYQNAKLFVFPSLYEGFGIPVIEAMSKGLKCVLSDIPVFREIGDNSVIYVNPEDIFSIKSGIEKGLKENKEKILYSKLSQFSWDKSAKKVIDLIKKIENIEGFL